MQQSESCFDRFSALIKVTILIFNFFPFSIFDSVVCHYLELVLNIEYKQLQKTTKTSCNRFSLTQLDPRIAWFGSEPNW